MDNASGQEGGVSDPREQRSPTDGQSEGLIGRRYPLKRKILKSWPCTLERVANEKRDLKPTDTEPPGRRCSAASRLDTEYYRGCEGNVTGVDLPFRAPRRLFCATAIGFVEAEDI